ncbi:helix-turn-helix domain-containing protein [Enterobacter asburiae]|uniref:helix-turn-helix domain-containing protein n=1 Tax=Enterobacter asburiae TaxID=61645 RepID=UPI00192B8EBA|nr:helix-turn-helix domain-containing protein [Enterobacter asburiae]MBL5926028.1 helix-turn-helix domain-containing protein [Enterobacter asburiae]MBL5956813.1 helix-turn-helix domain-containing protein [Enterobacter asburiae]
MTCISSQLAAERIIEKIEKADCFHMVVADEKQAIKFCQKETQYIYCLRSGEAEVRRLSDNTVVAYVKAPAITGLTIQEQDTVFHYLRTTRPAELMAVRLERALHLIEKQSLWQEAFTLCVEIANKCYIRDEAFASRNVYGIARQHIEMLWEMDEEERRRFSVFEFILSRTTISRSSLNKILKDLSTGGYITMYRGKLLDKKSLPANY